MTDRDLDRNVVTAAEYAELGPDFARRVGEPADVRNRPAGPPEVADDDLVLGELDMDGHGSGTFVAKGDPIPPASGSRDVVRPLGLASD